MKRVHVAAAVIRGADGKILIARRADTQHQGGLWEFPGGKVELGESPSVALAREIAEELGLEISVGERLGRGTATVGTRLILLDVYAATITAGEASLREHAQITWAGAEDLPQFDWAEADVPCVGSVAAWLQGLQLEL